MGICEPRIFRFPGPAAGRTDQHVDIRQVIRNEIREPIGQIIVFTAISFDRAIDGVQIIAASLPFLRC